MKPVTNLAIVYCELGYSKYKIHTLESSAICNGISLISKLLGIVTIVACIVDKFTA